MAENTRLNLVIYDNRTKETFTVYGLLYNEARDIVNFQTLEDVDGRVGGGKWREYTKWHRIQVGI